MYQAEYYVPKKTGTQEEALEAVGLAVLLSQIVDESCDITDAGPYYSIALPRIPEEEDIDALELQILIPCIAKKRDDIENEDVKRLVTCLDMEEEGRRKAEYDKIIEAIEKQKKDVKALKLAKKDETERIKRLDDQKDMADEHKPSAFYPLAQAMRTMKFIESQQKILENLVANRRHYPEFVKFILMLYSSPQVAQEDGEKAYKKWLGKNKDISAGKVGKLAFLNPSRIKGLNREKADGISVGGADGFWLQEYVKLIGAFEVMVPKFIKVGSSYDTKLFVVSPQRMSTARLREFMHTFPDKLKGSTSVRLDISLILLTCKALIEWIEQYEPRSGAKPRTILRGFYTVYFKNMGNASSPTNLSFLGIPEFIDLKKMGADEWKDLLQEHIETINFIRIDIGKMDERGEVMELLRLYRLFITTENEEYFFEFLELYAAFIMQKYGEGKKYVRAFSPDNMEVLLMCANEKKCYSEVFEVEGFRNIAKAIRLSTVIPQYHKDHTYPIKYGMAQDLKRKSAYREELIEYLSDFVAWYNSNIAKVAEKDKNNELKKEHKIRAMIKAEDLEEVVKLIDDHQPSIVGRLLCAYGYTMERKKDKEKGDTSDDIQPGN